MNGQAYGAVITAAEATALQRPRFRFYRRPRPAFERSPELIHLPCRKVSLGLSRDSKPMFLVNAYAGLVNPIDDEGFSRERIVAEFSYSLDEDETLRRVRESLVQWRLARLVRSRESLDPRVDDVVHYPYWVVYQAKGRPGSSRLQFRMVDALTGRSAPQPVRLGFLEALRAKSQAETKID